MIVKKIVKIVIKKKNTTLGATVKAKAKKKKRITVTGSNKAYLFSSGSKYRISKKKR